MDAFQFEAFVRKVRELWSTYRVGDEEIKARVWKPKLSRVAPEVVGEALARHASEAPDAVKPNWSRIFQLIWEKTGTGLNEFESLLAMYRRDRNPGLREKFCSMSDEAVWEYFVKAQIWGILFRAGGPNGSESRPAPDIQHAIGMAQKHVESLVASWSQRLEESNCLPPPWLGNVGVPEQWLKILDSYVAKENGDEKESLGRDANPAELAARPVRASTGLFET